MSKPTKKTVKKESGSKGNRIATTSKENESKENSQINSPIKNQEGWEVLKTFLIKAFQNSPHSVIANENGLEVTSMNYELLVEKVIPAILKVISNEILEAKKEVIEEIIKFQEEDWISNDRSSGEYHDAIGDILKKLLSLPWARLFTFGYSGGKLYASKGSHPVLTEHFPPEQSKDDCSWFGL